MESVERVLLRTKCILCLSLSPPLKASYVRIKDRHLEHKVGQMQMQTQTNTQMQALLLPRGKAELDYRVNFLLLITDQ